MNDRFKFKVVVESEDNKVVFLLSTNSYTLSDIDSYNEIEWEFSDGSTIPSNDAEDFGCIIKWIQCTGFKDKNGELIFFDDIVDDRYCSDRKCVRVVNELTVAHWIRDDDRMNSPMSSIEVIGNIYENPELLKENVV